jgi:hypothetical protein
MKRLIVICEVYCAYVALKLGKAIHREVMSKGGYKKAAKDIWDAI